MVTGQKSLFGPLYTRDQLSVRIGIRNFFPEDSTFYDVSSSPYLTTVLLNNIGCKRPSNTSKDILEDIFSLSDLILSVS